MDMIAYHQSILKELEALKNRIRNLMDEPHWLTDGEWKESVLRSVLRRHLPDNIHVGRGFIFTPNQCSSQIDILLYDSSCPVIFRDGDLVFVTPDAVRGIVEVKSRVTNVVLSSSLEKLSADLDLLNRGIRSVHPIHFGKWDYFIGLFSYEADVRDSNTVLQMLKEKADGQMFRVVTHVSLGSSLFIRYWSEDPEGGRERNKWHSYKLDELAPAYFISNLISFLSPHSVRFNPRTWFPLSSKELRKTGQIFLTDGG